MPEVVANYLTVDEFGRVQAEFAGHIIGTGVVLPIGGQISPNDDNAVTWYLDQRVPASDPRGRKGFIRGTTDGQIPDVFSVSHQATRVDRSATAEIDAQVSAGLPPGWADSARISLLAGSMGKDAEQRLLLDGAGLSDFLQVANIILIPRQQPPGNISSGTLVAWSMVVPMTSRYLLAIWGSGFAGTGAQLSWFTVNISSASTGAVSVESGMMPQTTANSHSGFVPAIGKTPTLTKGQTLTISVVPGFNFTGDQNDNYVGVMVPCI